MLTWKSILPLLVLALVLAGCTGAPKAAPTAPAVPSLPPSPVPFTKTPETPAPAATATAVLSTTVAVSATATVSTTTSIPYDRVQIAAAGLAIDAPRGWTRVGTDWAWTRPSVSTQRVAVVWSDRKPGWEPTSMLPKNAVTLNSVPVELSWAKGLSYNVEVKTTASQGSARASVETHNIVLTDKRAYDFYASAPTAAELAGLGPVLAHMLDSAALSTEPAAGTATVTAPGAATASAPATPIPNCTDRATWVKDVTIPDNTVMAAGASFVKTWRLQNTGTCTWDSSYSLVFSNGEIMGAAQSIPLTTTVTSGSTIDLSVNLTAPATAGTYESGWKLSNGKGTQFGFGASGQAAIFAKIRVTK